MPTMNNPIVKPKLYLSKVIATLLFTMMIAFIFYNSLQSGAASSEMSQGVLAFLQGILDQLGIGILFSAAFVRTLAHFLEFLLLGVLVSINILVWRSKIATNRLLSISILIPAIDEVIQLFTPERAFQIGDLLVDYLGLLIGIIMIYLMKRRKTVKS